MYLWSNIFSSSNILCYEIKRVQILVRECNQWELYSGLVDGVLKCKKARPFCQLNIETILKIIFKSGNVNQLETISYSITVVIKIILSSRLNFINITLNHMISWNVNWTIYIITCHHKKSVRSTRNNIFIPFPSQLCTLSSSLRLVK